MSTLVHTKHLACKQLTIGATVMDIIIDTRGDSNLVTRDRLIESDEDDLDFENTGTRSSNFFNIEEDLIDNAATSKKAKRDTTKDIDLEEFEFEMGWSGRKGLKKGHQEKATKNPVPVAKDTTAIDEILKKSVIKPGFEQLEFVPSGKVGKKKLQAMKRKERAQTKGKDWFNMRAPEMTPQIKHDLQVLKMRSVLDPKRFYKKNDLKVLPKYFQIGKVIDSPVDYYSSRLTKKERKKTIVDELMADAEFSKYNKRKYKEIIDEKKKLHYKAHKHAKRLKGKKK